MESLFLSRRSALARLLDNRRELTVHAGALEGTQEQDLETLNRLILDVRAGRIDAFELRHPGRSRVTVSAD